MSIKIAFFHNLPDGGGMRMLEKIIERYGDILDIDLYTIGEKRPRKIKGANNIFIKVYPWKGFVLRNLWIMCFLKKIHRKLALVINQKYSFVFVTHDYFTKAPFLLRYLKIDSYYLCQEAQREFYESSKIHAPLLKDKIANLIRYPIKFIDRKNVRNATILFCNSLFSKKNLEKIYKRKFQVVYPGVDIKKFSPSRIKKTNQILCVGGINSVKGQDFIIESLKPILNQYQLILIGNGRQEDIFKIKKMSSGYNVKIVKKISDKKLISLYRKAKVTCIAAHNEPFGLSSIESQSCGSPVVSVNEGGPTETIINGVTGILSSRKKDIFLRSVMKMLKKSESVGISARKNIVSNWDWEKTLRTLDKYMIK